ncbi:MAG: DUF1996 domain-containing protein [Cyanobacteria bacterium P01_F01_bin.150]
MISFKRVLFGCIVLATLYLSIWLGSDHVVADTYASLKFYNAANGDLLGQYDGSGDRPIIPWAQEITVRVSHVESQTGKMRLASDDCSSGSETDESGPFEFTIQPSPSSHQCFLKIDGWKSNSWDWQGHEEVLLSFRAVPTPTTSQPDLVSTTQPTLPSTPRPDPQAQAEQNPPPPDVAVALSPTGQNHPISNATTASLPDASSTLYRITQGTAGQSPMIGSDTSRSNHGVRIYCPPSHFAYDDPVLFPNEPGRSHLHVFIGNTEAQASSTPSSLLNNGNSSCEGGVHVRSSYWTPAVISGDQPVIPATTWIYYKTFMRNDNYEDLQVVPNGLQMLALSSTKGYRNQLKVEEDVANSHTRKRSLKLMAVFPNCLATQDGRWDGEPILDYRDMPDEASNIINSHVAYSENSADLNDIGCPKTHPYRIPTMSIHQYYHLEDLLDGWKLASDIERGTEAGESFHSDYIAAWDEETMEFINNCNRYAKSCDFEGGRGQLSERLRSPDGQQVYNSSHIVRPGTDMTPFGKMSATLQ